MYWRPFSPMGLSLVLEETQKLFFFLTGCIFGIQIIAHLYHKAPETEIKSITGISEMKSANKSIAELNHKAEGKTR